MQWNNNRNNIFIEPHADKLQKINLKKVQMSSIRYLEVTLKLI